MSISAIFQAVLSYNLVEVAEKVQNAVDSGESLEIILKNGLISAMDEVGKKFSTGEIFVPEMLMAAHAMKGGLEVLKPLLTDSESEPSGVVVIGTVKGDLHDIGKNLVMMMLEGAGFRVIDLGVDVDSESFIKAVKDNNAGVVALSALLTTTMPAMKDTVTALSAAGISGAIIGGAPVTQEFAEEIGAAGYGKDAPGAVALARNICGLA